MKTKAFTLIELLAVIIILGILATIVVPNIVGIINNSKKDTLNEQKRTVVDAAKRWGTDNTKKLPQSSCSLTITKLKTEGYLDSEKKVTDPTINKEMTGCVKIEYDSNNNQYKYTYIDTCTQECN